MICVLRAFSKCDALAECDESGRICNVLLQGWQTAVRAYVLTGVGRMASVLWLVLQDLEALIQQTRQSPSPSGKLAQELDPIGSVVLRKPDWGHALSELIQILVR